MKFILSALVFAMVGVTSVAAYEISVTEVARPYDVVVIEGDPESKHVYLGELEDFPVMYEVSGDEGFNFSAQVRQGNNQPADPTPFSLIVVRQNDSGGGVTEVARLRPTVEDWTQVKDSVLGMSFLESEKMSTIVEPGIYRIEISTPENHGRYMLTIGENAQSSGYFETLGNIRTTQKFFGFSFLKMLTSSYVYYPMGIFLLLFVIYRTWKYRKAIAHVD